MNHTFENLEKQLAKNTIHPVYLLTGEEFFFRRKALKALKDQIPEELDFNYNVFDAKTPACASKTALALKTLPIGEGRRLVVCHDIHRFKEKDWEELQPMIQNPEPRSVLVMTADELDKRKKSSKFLQKYSQVILCGTPPKKELFGWVQTLAQSLQMKISRDTASLLIHWAGSSLSHIENELKKIKCLIQTNQWVQPEDVLKVSARLQPENVFSFTEAVGQKNFTKAFHFLSQLLEDRQSEVGILMLMVRHIRILSQIKEGLNEGLSIGALGSKAGVPVFFLDNYIHQAQLWKDQQISQVFQLLYTTDKQLKTSKLPPSLCLENFVFKACSL